MKRLSSLLIACAFLIISCKKNENHQPEQATPAQLNNINTQLSGTWASAVIPSNSSFPYSGSIIFDGQASASFTDYADNQTQKSYTLLGEDGAWYININTPDLVRKSKITKLTADSLKLQSTVAGTGLTSNITINEVFVKAKAADINNKVFKIYILPFTGNTALYYNLNVNIKIYVTPQGGAEQLVDSKNNITQAYAYAYNTATGDHIRIAITNASQPGNIPVLTCLATYKGVPYGKDWQSALFSSLPDKAWDINN